MSRGDRAAGIVLLAGSTLALAWIVSPLRSAIVWAVVASMLFAPVFAAIERRIPGYRNGCAALTCLIMVVSVGGPAVAVAGAAIHETAALLSSPGGAVDLPQSLDRLLGALPASLRHLVGENPAQAVAGMRGWLMRRLDGGAIALLGGAIGVGQGAFAVAVQIGVMLYLSFFLIRDGEAIMSAIVDHLPLSEPHSERLVATARTVLRATVRGTLVVALVQGALGGLIFAALGIPGAVLWALVMAFMALLPPFGSAVVWAPMALFLVLTGEVWRAAVLALLGLFLIGLIDNLLRPLLVGREARLPESLVLLSTLGGLALLGLDGIVLGPLIAALCLAGWAEVRSPAPRSANAGDVT